MKKQTTFKEMVMEQGYSEKDFEKIISEQEKCALNPGPKVYVCDSDTYINLDEVKIINISQNFFGEDVIDFEYEGKDYTSKVTYNHPV